jgi:hypothetical protein
MGLHNPCNRYRVVPSGIRPILWQKLGLEWSHGSCNNRHSNTNHEHHCWILAFRLHNTAQRANYLLPEKAGSARLLWKENLGPVTDVTAAT